MIQQIKHKVSSITNPHLYTWSFEIEDKEYLTIKKYENSDGYGTFITVYVKPQNQ